MTNKEAGVRHEGAIERIEIFRSGGPVPWQTLLQRLERHAFNASQHPHEVVAILWSKRRNGEATVTTNDGGYTMQRRWAE